jgi:uncharacterized membrane protein
MRFLKAYLSAWFFLFKIAYVGWLFTKVFMYVFFGAANSSLITYYLIYLICVAALGGVVGEWMNTV